MKKKFLPLETYRGFAAFMIAAVHFNTNSPLVNHSLANGYFVQFFFCLSGFVIYFNYQEKINNIFDFIYFIKKRFLRLYPLHFFFLIIFTLIEIIKFFLFMKYELIANNAALSKNDIFSFLANLLMLQTFLKEYTFNAPSWSISSEFWTYIIFAIIIILKFNYKINLIILFIIFIFRIINNNEFGASNSGYLSLIDCIYSFFWGVFFSKLYLNFYNNKFYIKLSYFFSIFFLLLIFFLIPTLRGKYLFILPIIFSSLIFFSCNIKRNSYLGVLLCNKFFIYLGKISYSIYMSHLLIFWIATNTLRFIFKFDTFQDTTGSIKLNLSLLEANILVIACYFFTVIFSILSYKYIEKKFYKN